MDENYLSYPEAAARLGLNLNTLYSLVHSKRIPHVRLGRRLIRFSATALTAWLNSNTISPENTSGTVNMTAVQATPEPHKR